MISSIGERNRLAGGAPVGNACVDAPEPPDRSRAFRPDPMREPKMTGSRDQALAEARKLLRGFGAAPDARRRAQAVLSALRQSDDWSAAGRRQLEAAEAWLRAGPSATALEPKLRALLTTLATAR
jgi:hypothetical protein